MVDGRWISGVNSQLKSIYDPPYTIHQIRRTMNSLFLKTALRNLLKRKGSALLNVLGLVIGISCSLLIFQYVSYEPSYDSFQSASSRIQKGRGGVKVRSRAAVHAGKPAPESRRADPFFRYRLCAFSLI